MRLMIPLILWSVIMVNPAAAASSITPFAGSWTGQAIDTADGSVQAEAISIEISEQRDGFELYWRDLAKDEQGHVKARALQARFVKTNREGVFEVAPKEGSFLDRMFASPEKGNPLDGETLLWARLDAENLAVYSLTIDRDGGFKLDHYTWTRTDEGLDLKFREQSEGLGEALMIEGQLIPAEG